MRHAHSLRSLVQSLTRSSRHNRRSARPAHPRTFTPRMEQLEELTLLNCTNPTVLWTNPASGDWMTPTNWSTGQVPGANDRVCINTPGITVTHSQGDHTIQSLTSRAAFVMSGGVLTFPFASELLSTFEFTGGTFGGAGHLVLRGVMTWSGGMMVGPGSTHAHEGVRFTFTGNNGLDGRTLHNYGLTRWLGTGELDFRNGAVFNNLRDAVVVIQNTATFLVGAGTRDGTFQNAGTFRVDVGGEANFHQGSNGKVVFNNTANTPTNRVWLNGGHVNLHGGGTNTGVIDVGAESNFNIRANTFGLNAGSQLTGAGWFRVDGGVTSINAPISVPNYELHSGVTTGYGVLTVTANLNWTGGEFVSVNRAGTTVVSAGARLNILGPDLKLAQSRDLKNFGTATWTGTGQVQFRGGARLYNEVSGLFDLRSDATLAFTTSGSRLENSGLFRKGAGNMTSTITGLVVNTGRMEVWSGRMELTGFIENANEIHVHNGTRLTVESMRSFAASNLIGNGSLRFAGTSEDVQGTIDLTGDIEISGVVAFTGTMSARSLLNANAFYLLTPETTVTVTGDFVQNSTDPIWTPATHLFGSTINVGGSVHLRNGEALGSGTINGNVLNEALLKVGGEGVAGLLVINGNYTQTGTGVLEIEIGSLDTGYDQLQVRDTAMLDGALNIKQMEEFNAVTDDNFHILAFRDCAGGFATINGLDLGNDLYFDPRYGTEGLDLVLMQR